MASSKTLDPPWLQALQAAQGMDSAGSGSWWKSFRLGGGEESQVVLSTSGNHSNQKYGIEI